MSNGVTARAAWTITAQLVRRAVAAFLLSAAVLLPSTMSASPAAAAEPQLLVDATATTRQGRMTVGGTGCDGYVDVSLYSGQGSSRVLAGFGEHEPDGIVLMFIPAWIPLDQDLTFEAVCLNDDLSVAFSYEPFEVELRPDVSLNLRPVTGALNRTAVAQGQAITFTGDPCIVESVDPDLLDSLLVVFEGSDLADPGQPVAIGAGPVDGEQIAPTAILTGGVEPGPHVVLPLCTNYEGWLAWPPTVVTVTANPAAETLSVTPSDEGLRVSGQGCLFGSVEVSVYVFDDSDLRGGARTRNARAAGDDVVATVTPGVDGSWSYDWDGPLDAYEVVVEAACGDPAADGFVYDAQVVRNQPTESTTVPTPTTAPGASTGGEAQPAQPVAGTATYAG